MIDIHAKAKSPVRTAIEAAVTPKLKTAASTAVWSIAGHDPFGGAGIAADTRVAAALRQPLRTVIASMTAQNDKILLAAEPVPKSWLNQQWQALAQMERPGAYKVGLVLTSETIQWLADTIDPEVTLIVDPVFKTSSGTSFLDDDSLGGLKEYLFQSIDLLTPNRPETEALVGFPIRTSADLKRAAAVIRSQGVSSVLIKGGHGEGDTLLDYFDDGIKPFFLSAKRKPGNFRGTGCTLSTAIACFIAQGLDLRDAVVAAHSYVQAAIETSWVQASIPDPRAVSETPEPGSTHVSVKAMPNQNAPSTLPLHSHLPSVFATAPLSELFYDGDSPSDARFTPLRRSLGFYPVLPSVEWIARFAKSGVKTVQLRIKDQSPEDLRASMVKAKAICEQHDIALFVNDAWQLAIELSVYGVHLGQEDLDALSNSELELIRSSGLRLGLSTHSLEEAARAKTLRPSYIALGPVFETTCKSMRFGPQGIPRVGEWVRRLPGLPIVAIGGLHLDHAAAVIAQGADSIAVISDLIRADDPEHRMNAWLKVFDS